MREKLALLKAYFKNKLAFGKNKKTRKGFILTMVALVEVLAISVVSVSAWVETISTITFKVEDGKIDSYVYTNADIGSGDGYAGKTINLNDYFRAAGEVHLASASSADGKNIFFPIKKTTESTFKSYRSADINDKNVNYIDFSFNVKIDNNFAASNANFFFSGKPSITVEGQTISDADNPIRMAITDTSTQTTVVCGTSDSTANVVSNTDGFVSPENVSAFSHFEVNSATTPLFTVARGSSKTINIKVWLQDDKAATEYAGKKISVSGINIVTQEKRDRTVYFVDRTIDSSKQYWATGVTFQQGNSDAVEMKFDGVTHTYSCSYNTYSDDTVVKFTSGNGVTWTTDMKSLNTGESMYYTAYGSYNSQNEGYGTWGDVLEIRVLSADTTVLPTTGNVGSIYMITDTSDVNSKVRMPRTSVEGEYVWIGYIAKDKANNITFSFKNNGKEYSIAAPNRGTSQKFVVTSAETGYWSPPATITVFADKTECGSPTVKYGDLNKSEVSVTPGTKVQLCAKPKDGYEFKNWVYSGTTNVVSDIDNNGYFTPSKSGSYKFTAMYSKLYDFEAYVRTSDGKSLNSSTDGGTVTIKCGDNSAAVDTTDETHYTLKAAEGSTVTYTATAKDGYKFDGWYIDEACTGTPESTNSKYELSSVSASKKLYARFNIETYDVLAYAQYGTVCPDGDAGKVSFDNSTYKSEVSTKVNYNGKVTFYAKPESGYAFIGWYKNTTDEDPTVGVGSCTKIKDSNGNYYYTYTTTITTNGVELYARFKALYKVEAYAMYNNENVDTGGTVKVGNGDDDKLSFDSVMDGESVTVKATAKDGYKFDGWYNDKACTDKYSTNSEQTLENVTKGITLYAKFVSDETIIYFYNTNNWTNVYAYMWENSIGGGNSNAKFPGESMTYLGGKVWSYKYSPSKKKWDKVIFSNNGSSQTGNLDIGDDKYYKNGWQSSSNIQHTVTVSSVSNADVTVTTGSQTIAEGKSAKVYDGTSLTLNASNVASGYLFKNFIVTPSSGTASTLTTNHSRYTIDGSDVSVTATISSSTKTFYFENTLDWSNFKIYYSDNSVSWPGQALTTVVGSNNGHNNIYSVDLDTSKISFVVLNNGGTGANQTVDIYLSDFGNNNACWISSDLQGGKRKVGGYYSK